MRDSEKAATVQKENGHSPVAHPILEALALAPLNGGQMKIVLHVIRQTYGWSRRDAAISYSDFTRATGFALNTVRRATAELIEAGVLQIVRESSFNKAATYRLQKDPRKWGKYACTPASLSVPSEGQSASVGAHSGGTNGVPASVQSASTGAHSSGTSTVPSYVHSNGSQPVADNAVTGTENNIKQDIYKKDDGVVETSSGNPRTHDNTTPLREYLADKAIVVDRFVASAEQPKTWGPGIMGLYGPHGTDEQVWKGIPEASRPSILAVALDRYAAEAKAYTGRYFRRFLESARNEWRELDEEKKTTFASNTASKAQKIEAIPCPDCTLPGGKRITWPDGRVEERKCGAPSCKPVRERASA